MKIRLYPYKLASNGAKLLQQALREMQHNVLRLRTTRVLNKPRKKINWGSSVLSDPSITINDCNGVLLAKNKTYTLTTLHHYQIPAVVYTTEISIAQQWIREGHTVVVRHKLSGKGGEGIEIISEGEVPEAPLYTQYFKKKAEYRVHVMNGEVILVQQKLKKRGVKHDTQVRNHNNGYVFSVNCTVPPDPAVLVASVNAVRALGLTFGAVDIGWNEKKKQCAVFEVNTAPGLTPSTAKKYAESFIKYLEEV